MEDSDILLSGRESDSEVGRSRAFADVGRRYPSSLFGSVEHEDYPF